MLNYLSFSSWSISSNNCCTILCHFRLRWGWVICELRTANWRTGNVRTNSANYGREPRVQCEPESANFFAIKRGFCIRNVEITFITIQTQKETDSMYMLQKYHKTTRVRCGGSYLHYTGPMYMRCLSNKLTRRKKLSLKYCLVLHIWK